MTASQPPDPRHLPSWSAAFAYPLPTVRSFELQLRKNVDEHRSKLRSLVGSQYRDLLGTAETIITMDERMTLAEEKLSEIGRRCNLARIERTVKNSVGFGEEMERRRRWWGREGNEAIRGERMERRGGVAGDAMVKILIDGLNVTGKIIRTSVSERARRRSAGGIDQGDALLAAKLLILARLLLKSVEQGDVEGEKVELLEGLRKRTMGLRRKLLGFIERSILRDWSEEAEKEVRDEEEDKFNREEERRDSLVNGLSAYALITSSSPADVLRYFLQTNLTHLTADFEGQAPTRRELENVWRRYGQTLADTKKLFPRLIADSLSRVSKAPLSQDPQITALSEINLDVYGRWIPEDVRTFTPWVRHDELTQASVGSALKSWTVQAQKVVVGTVEASLRGQEDAQAIMETRSSVFQQYFTICAQNRGPEQFHALDELRRVFVERMGELASEQVGKASFDLQDSADALSGGLWELADMDLSTKSGASRMRKSILQRLRGHDTSLQVITARLDAMIDSFHRLWQATISMSTTRWDDLDLDDLEDEDDMESKIQESLNKIDPQLVQTAIRTAAAETINKLYQLIETASSQSITTPARLLRVLREVDERHDDLTSQITNLEVSFDATSLTKKLHETLAQKVVDPIWKAYKNDLESNSLRTKSLWEGTPPLPIQPDPHVFRLLMDLQRTMSSTGSDLWNQQATRAVKIYLAKKIAERTQSRYEHLQNSTSSGEIERNGDRGDVDTDAERDTSQAKETSRDATLQLLFDTFYLGHALAVPENSAEDLSRSVGTMLTGNDEVDALVQERLKKSAGEYWKRTYLLLGHLAN